MSISQIILYHERSIIVEQIVVEMLFRVEDEALFFRFLKHLLYLFLLRFNEQQNYFIFETYIIQRQMFHLQQ